MSAITDFDVGPLTWVKGEIDQALNQARDKLAQFAGNFSDTSQLRFCQTHLHQVTGAVQMVGLEGVARLGQEIENLVEALEKQEIAATAEIVAVVTRGIDALAKYLDDLIAGEPDQAIRLFPVISALQQARGATPLAESELFFPDLSVRAPKHAHAPQLSDVEMSALVKKARAKFQRGLLGWLKQDNPTQPLQWMREALGEIEQAQAQPANRTFWWAATAFVDALLHQGLEADVSTKQLCSRIDMQMRRLVEGSQKVAERLLRDVLYGVARSKKVSERINEVSRSFELDDYLPASVEEKAPGTDVQPLLRELRDMLGTCKETWLKYTSGNKDSLKSFQEQFGKLQGKLQGVDNPILRQLVDQVAQAAGDAGGVEAHRADAVALEMATAMLLIENALERFEHLGVEFVRQADTVGKRLQAAVYGNIDITQIPDMPLLDEMTRRAQEKLLFAQVAHEIKSNLAHAEEVLDSFFRDQTKRTDIPSIEPYLAQVLGALYILELERGADLLKGCQELIRAFANPEHQATQEELELVADGLSSLGFYIEAVQHGRANPFEIIGPVLKRFPGFKGRAFEEEATEQVEAPEPTIEAGLHDQLREAQSRLNEWQQEGGNEAAKESLRETLTTLRQDADLVADDALKQRAAEAINLLDQAGAAPSETLAESIASLTTPKPQVEPSQEAVRLASESDEAIDAELLETYLEEATEVLERVQENLEICRSAPHDREALTTIRRGFHTLKGSGRMVGLTTLGEVAWEIEQTMNKWLADERSATPDLLELIKMAHDSFGQWVEQLKASGNADVQADALVALATRLRTGEVIEAPVVELEAVPTEEAEAAAESSEVTLEVPVAEESIEAAPSVEEIATVELPSLEVAEEPVVLESAAPVAETEEVVLTGTPLEVPAIEEEEPAPATEEAESMTLESLAPELAEADVFEAAIVAEAPPDLAIEVETAEQPAPEMVEPEAPAALAEIEEVIAEPAVVEPAVVMEIPPQPEAAEAEVPPASVAEVEPVAEGDIVIGGVEISPALFEIFLAEAGQHIDALKTYLSELMAHPADPIQHDFMRAAHTLCGIARTTGFEALAELGYALEQWLFDALQYPLAFTDKQLKTTDESIARLARMVEEIGTRKAPKPAKQLIRSLNALLNRARSERERQQVEMERARTEVPVPAVAEGAAAVVAEPEPAVPAEILVEEVLPLPAQSAEPTERRAIRDDLDEQLLPIFLEEAQELFPQIGEQLREWRTRPQDQAIQNSLQRALHTLKGSARMAGAMRLGELTHHMEARVLEAQGAAELPDSLFDELEGHFDRLADSLDRLQRGEPVVEPLPEEVAQTAAPVVAAIPAAARQKLTLPVEAEQAAQQRAQIRVRADLVDRLVNEAGEVSIARSRVEGEMLGFKQGLLDLTENVIRLRNQLREIEIQAESQMQSRMSLLQEVNSNFDPLEFDRFTRFQELTRMMAESVNDVSTVQQNLLKNLDEVEAALLAQGRMTKDLQQQLMHIRMVPFSSLSDRLYRVVRQAAKDAHKKANLDIRGAQVEIDRSVLEKMTAPFEHLLRNAIAHGLEDPGARAAAGKPDFGQIQLEVRQEGNEVVLSFSDDGAGMDLEAIRSKAIANGLLEDGVELAPAQLMDMIFVPGFSTAKEVTQLSGRGIGMDVVRNEIADLGGRVEVSSERSKGTTFTIHLPLTLAVTQTVLVNAGGQTYALPSVMVAQVQELKPDTLAKVYETTDIEWMGEHYPFTYLPRLLGNAESVPPVQRYNSVILLRSGPLRAAVHVDELIGNREVVVKNIGPQLARVPGIAGATVLGDGRVVMILNPVQLAHREAAPVAISRVAPKQPVVEEKAAEAPLVMVVDDSLTVRKITSRLLAREGYQVVTAKDGVDALQQLTEVMPDVMLVDIEMPRMDGFELTKNVRGDAKTASIPIIMITSRTADKHRNYAKELGVNEYLGKPYQEEELLMHIKSFLKH